MLGLRKSGGRFLDKSVLFSCFPSTIALIRLPDDTICPSQGCSMRCAAQYKLQIHQYAITQIQMRQYANTQTHRYTNMQNKIPSADLRGTVCNARHNKAPNTNCIVLQYDTSEVCNLQCAAHCTVQNRKRQPTLEAHWPV